VGALDEHLLHRTGPLPAFDVPSATSLFTSMTGLSSVISFLKKNKSGFLQRIILLFSSFARLKCCVKVNNAFEGCQNVLARTKIFTHKKDPLRSTRLASIFHTSLAYSSLPFKVFHEKFKTVLAYCG
jgi:hypothetical protein